MTNGYVAAAPAAIPQIGATRVSSGGDIYQFQVTPEYPMGAYLWVGRQAPAVGGYVAPALPPQIAATAYKPTAAPAEAEALPTEVTTTEAAQAPLAGMGGLLLILLFIFLISR